METLIDPLPMRNQVIKVISIACLKRYPLSASYLFRRHQYEANKVSAGNVFVLISHCDIKHPSSDSINLPMILQETDGHQGTPHLSTIVPLVTVRIYVDGLVQHCSVSYTRVCETSTGCLRSIYPSLGMRQVFGDVTMGQWRHN